LAAGDEFVIKFWDMDNTNLLTTVRVMGDYRLVPASGSIRMGRC